MGMYLTGVGVHRNYARALDLIHKAAEQGFVHAQVNLAWMYETGTGTSRNKFEAAKRYSKASAQGHDMAREAFKRSLRMRFFPFFDRKCPENPIARVRLPVLS